VFGLGPATKIYVAVEAVDMRKGFEGLYGLVRDHLRHDPLSGHLFLFTNKTKTRWKALVWDGSGLWVCAKRLEKGIRPTNPGQARPAFQFAGVSWASSDSLLWARPGRMASR
jgi:transposase